MFETHRRLSMQGGIKPKNPSDDSVAVVGASKSDADDDATDGDVEAGGRVAGADAEAGGKPGTAPAALVDDATSRAVETDAVEAVVAASGGDAPHTADGVADDAAAPATDAEAVADEATLAPAASAATATVEVA